MFCLYMVLSIGLLPVRNGHTQTFIFESITRAWRSYSER